MDSVSFARWARSEQPKHTIIADTLNNTENAQRVKVAFVERFCSPVVPHLPQHGKRTAYSSLVEELCHVEMA